MKRMLGLIFVGLLVLAMSTVVLADPQFAGGTDEDGLVIVNDVRL